MSKSKKGRPTKYRETYIDQAKMLCLMGFTDQQLATFFGVSEKTINTWKEKYPKFLQSIKEGKAQFDEKKVEKALLDRALGVVKTTNKFKAIPVKDDEGNVTGSEMVLVERIEEEVPSDVRALQIWLYNRDPERWRQKQEIHVTGENPFQISNDIKPAEEDEQEAVKRDIDPEAD